MVTIMNDKMTLDELTEKVNNIMQSDNYQSSDKRHKETLTSRRIRDYVSKGMVSKPEKEGKSVFYTEKHYNEVLHCRKLQQEGLNDQLIKKIIDSNIINEEAYSDNDLLLQEKAKDTLKDLFSPLSACASVETSSRSFLDSSHLKSSSQPMNLIKKYIDEKPNFETSTVTNYKLMKEYPIEEDGKVVLKIEEGYELKNPEEILKKIKLILKIGE